MFPITGASLWVFVSLRRKTASFELLATLARLLVDGARELTSLLGVEHSEREAVASRIRDIEHDADEATHAIMLKVTGRNLRAAVEGIDNPVDFRLIGRKWIASSGAVVTFEFPVEIGMEFLQTLTDVARSQERGLCALGGDCVIRRMADSGNGHTAPN